MAKEIQQSLTASIKFKKEKNKKAFERANWTIAADDFIVMNPAIYKPYGPKRLHYHARSSVQARSENDSIQKIAIKPNICLD